MQRISALCCDGDRLLVLSCKALTDVKPFHVRDVGDNEASCRERLLVPIDAPAHTYLCDLVRGLVCFQFSVSKFSPSGVRVLNKSLLACESSVKVLLLGK